MPDSRPQESGEDPAGRWGHPPPAAWDPVAILAEGALTADRAKTAVGAIRYASCRVVAVIDSCTAPSRVSDHLGVGGEVPVVGTLDEAVLRGARALLIGIAPRGGALPPAWRPTLAAALAGGINVASGLHTLLAEDEEMCAAASRGKGVIWDLRRCPRQLPLARGSRVGPPTRVILTVGTDCHTGKMTAALELHRAALSRKLASAFVPTGQTGIFIAGWGVAVDRVPGDFISGVVEEMIRLAAPGQQLIWVEGQGTIYHPAYSGVSAGLIHGAQPDGQILCHVAGRERVAGYETPIPSLTEAIRRHEQVASWVRPAPVLGIALVTKGLAGPQAEELIDLTARETGLPVTDCVRFGAGALLEAVECLL